MTAGDIDDSTRLTRMMAEIGVICRTIAPSAMISGRVVPSASAQDKASCEGAPPAHLIGVRVVVSTLEQCRRVVDQLHRCYRRVPSEYDVNVVPPKPNGYRSLRTTLLDADGRPVKVQVLTFGVHFETRSGTAAHGRSEQLQDSGRSLLPSHPREGSHRGR